MENHRKREQQGQRPEKEENTDMSHRCAKQCKKTQLSTTSRKKHLVCTVKAN
jgi:hypothetical protein